MYTAKHAHRGTMKALQELGLDKNVETVDDVAKEIAAEQSKNKQIQSKSDIMHHTEIIHIIDPDKICNWQFNDRPEAELGNIDELANELQTIGQQQPCIVRPCNNNSLYDYEIIAGERRWRAAKLAAIKLKVIIKDLNDHDAALCQASENHNRKGLSDFARGMNYAKLINDNVLTQKDLEMKLGVNKVSVTRLLSFAHIPVEIWDAIGDTTKISARTASEIRALCGKGDNYKNAIISLAPRLKTGKLGANKLTHEINKVLNDNYQNKSHYKDVRDKTGRHLFSWRGDSNGNMSISFPKDMRKLINRDMLEKSLQESIEHQLNKLSEFPRGNSDNNKQPNTGGNQNE